MRSFMIAELEATPVLHHVAPPAPKPGEVMIATEACALNHADLLMMKGRYQVKPPLPFAPGGEVCGTITECGEGVDLQIGQRVIAYCGHGGLADCVTAKAAVCTVISDGLDAGEAATLPVAYGTAQIALARRARLRAGETVVVTGAGGGAGLTGVEVAALMGARVIAIAGNPAKREAALAKGAALTLDPAAFDLGTSALKDHLFELTAGQGVDVLYDVVGDALGAAAARGLGFEGRFLPIGFAAGEPPALKANHLLVKNQDVVGVWFAAYFDKRPDAIGTALAQVVDWAQTGRIKPLVSDRFPLARAGEALALLHARKALGKIVVTP